MNIKKLHVKSFLIYVLICSLIISLSLEKEVENNEEVVKDQVRHTEVDVENLNEEERMKRETDQKNRRK